MDNEPVVLSVTDGLLEGLFRLVMALPQGVPEAGAQAEFQVSLLVQIGDQILDPVEALLIRSVSMSSSNRLDTERMAKS